MTQMRSTSDSPPLRQERRGRAATAAAAILCSSDAVAAPTVTAAPRLCGSGVCQTSQDRRRHRQQVLIRCQRPTYIWTLSTPNSTRQSSRRSARRCSAAAAAPAPAVAVSEAEAEAVAAASEAFAWAAASPDDGSSDRPATLHAMRRGAAPTRSPSTPPACRRTLTQRRKRKLSLSQGRQQVPRMRPRGGRRAGVEGERLRALSALRTARGASAFVTQVTAPKYNGSACLLCAHMYIHIYAHIGIRARMYAMYM